MTDLEFLRAMRRKIETPERWTQLAYARNASGVEVSPLSQDAVCWCIRGACRAVSDEHYFGLPLNELLNIASTVGFNDADSTTHADVLAKLDEAIARLEAAA